MKAKSKLILAMITFGTLGIFAKNIPLASSEIALYRGVIAMAVLFFLLLISGRIRNLVQVKSQLWKLLLSGAAMGFNWILLFEAYQYTSIALSTLSYYFAPVLVMVASIFLFREQVNGKQVVCFILSTAGLVLAIGVSGGGTGTDLIGILFGLGAACLYATVVLINKSVRDIDGITRTFCQFAFAVLVLLPYVGFTNGFHLGSLDATGFVNLLIVGAFHTGFVYFLYFSSLTELRGQEIAILSYIDPFVAVLLSVIWLHEPVTVLQLVGGGMIVVFTLINELVGHKKEHGA